MISSRFQTSGTGFGVCLSHQTPVRADSGSRGIDWSSWPSCIECRLRRGGWCATRIVKPRELVEHASTTAGTVTIWTPGYARDAFWHWELVTDLDLPFLGPFDFPQRESVLVLRARNENEEILVRATRAREKTRIRDLDRCQRQVGRGCEGCHRQRDTRRAENKARRGVRSGTRAAEHCMC